MATRVELRRKQRTWGHDDHVEHTVDGDHPADARELDGTDHRDAMKERVRKDFHHEFT